MTWSTLLQLRNDLNLTERQFAALLGVAHSTYTGWGTRDKVPAYIAKSAIHVRLIRTYAPDLYAEILADCGISTSSP